jgi:hypothetical protein
LRTVPVSTVEIKIVEKGPGVVLAASLGFIPGSWNNDGGRHFISVASDFVDKYPWADQRSAIFAHEIGHVMGLLHEHQREDRDRYVYFNCSNIADYARVKAQVEHEGSFTMAQVCSQWYLGAMYNFMSTQFTTEPRWDRYHKDGEKHMWWSHNSAQYDFQSIMHYSSSAAAAGTGVARSLKEAVLLKWRYPDHNGPSNPDYIDYYNAELISSNDKPSKWDRIAIMYMYPWGKHW